MIVELYLGKQEHHVSRILYGTKKGLLHRERMNRSLSSRQMKKQKVFSRISDMRSCFFYAASSKLR